MKQGKLGDCYFISVCSAAAEYNNRVIDAFVTKTLNKEGIVVVKGRVLGIETNIAVDDYLPFFAKTTPNEPIFAKTSPSGGLWGAFLEKVWAKLNGNYEMIEGGWTGEVMRFISGSPTQTFNRDS